MTATDVKSRVRALLDAGKGAQAEALLRPHAGKCASDADLSYLLGAAHFLQGRHPQAKHFLEQATALHPGHARAFIALGMTLGKLRENEACLRACTRAVELAPADADAHATLGAMLLLQERLGDALAPLRRAHELAPADVLVMTNLSRALLSLSRAEEACVLLDRAVRAAPQDQGVLLNAVPALLYAPGIDARVRLSLARQLGELTERMVRAEAGAEARLSRVADMNPERPLRVGLLSYDFRRHSCASFLPALLTELSAHAMEVVCFSNCSQQDDVTARLRSLRPADCWVNVADVPLREVARAIASRRIDVLLELGGLTSGSGLPALCLRPAPVQGSYLGYPATTGTPGADFRIVEDATDTSDSDALHTERLVRMRGPFVCYAPPEDPPALAPMDASRPPTFACFSNSAKVSGLTLDLFASAMHAAPDAVLLLKSAAMGVREGEEHVLRGLAQRGVSRERVRRAAYLPTSEAHLRVYEQADVALDTAPYVATTTACEALLMGVPMVTMSGREHHTRVAGALLTHVGLPALVTGSVEAFGTVAARTLREVREQRTAWGGRENLRRMLLTSAVCDAPGFAARFAEAIRGVWREACATRAGGSS